MGYRVTYFEIGSKDFDVLVTFYRDLFGWKIENVMETYASVDTGAGGGLGGGIGKSSDGTPWSTFYVEAEDPQAVLDKAVALGGSVSVPVTEFPGVTFAMFKDLDANLVGVFKGAGGEAPAAEADGEQKSPGGVAVDWFEVLGSNAERTQGFYCDLMGWSLKEGQGAPNYRMVEMNSGEGAISGGLGAGEGGSWATVYASVPSAEAALAKAESLGGTREYGPMQVDDHTWTGAFRDPSGNLFGVYQHGPH
jgi:predicted enzyme related to lactoylglutathione lyase